MCGIFGYVGAPTDLARDVTVALRTLEYRGYDSWGIAIGVDREILVEKQVGRINGTVPPFPAASIGFGHTRWATHGGVTRANAHPHLDQTGRLAVIHNGIIENFQTLRAELTASGYLFRSETDSEVIAHLLHDVIAAGADLTSAVAQVFLRLEGLNAVIAMDVQSGEMVAAKNVSPLIVGLGNLGVTIASDALALQPHADRVVYLEDTHLVRLDRAGLSLYERSTMRPLTPATTALEQRHGDFGLGAYPHFMLKEVAEQPAVISGVADGGVAAASAVAEAIVGHSRTLLTGCGTAGYAALTGSYLLGQQARRQGTMIAGSEFKYHDHLLSPETLVIALSQSGETADLIEGMLTARAAGCTLGAIVNVPQSTLGRMVDLAFPIGAGPEQCVLSTKSYVGKVAAMAMITAALTGNLDATRRDLQATAVALQRLLDADISGQVLELARQIVDQPNLFVIGRGVAYPTALEAALKIKEASYIHAEAFAGGELKHGVIALVSEGTPCLVFAPEDQTRADIISGAMELKSRGGFIIGVSQTPDPVFDVHLAVPEVAGLFPLTHVVPAQLLGYHLAVLRGHNPDRPRNLAKSVTVK